MRILKRFSGVSAVFKYVLASPPDPMRILKLVKIDTLFVCKFACITTRSDEDTETLVWLACANGTR